MKPLTILLVEDNPDDIDLTREALAEIDVPTTLIVAEDGVKATELLRDAETSEQNGRPDIILLDLKLPRKGGLEVLADVKADDNLRRIPVVVLTTSDAERDVLDAYDGHANGYVVKPVDLDDFIATVTGIVTFWSRFVTLPPA